MATKPFAVDLDGQATTVRAGDLIDAELLRDLPNRGAGTLGRTLTMRQAEREVGYRPGEAQYVVSGQRAVVGENLPPRVDIPGPVDLPHGFQVDEGVVLPLGAEVTCAILMQVAEETGADIVYPAHNLAEPCSLPMNGDAGSILSRMPGGLSTMEIATGLAGRALPTVNARPHRPGCVYITPKVLLDVEAGHAGPLKEVTTPRAFVWRDRDVAGATAALVGSKGRSGRWADIVPLAHRAAREGASGRPIVAIYSTAIGPWGGVYVLFKIADELQKRGVHAFVVYSADVPHHYRPQTAPLKVRNHTQLANEWSRLVGDGAILLASHWGSGYRVAEIAEKNPEVLVTTILQDREDLFISPRGKSLAHDIRDVYLDIGRGASVSRWILDSAAEDLGRDVSDYRVIHAGLDLDVFHPGAGTRSEDEGGPVRVLAMWRPQTAQRRGGELLRKVYAELSAKYSKSEVSLEVFGFDDPTVPPPPGVVHHGILKPAEVAALMASVDIVTDPSAFQGFGLILAEAAACGACAVSTENLGINEWGEHLKTAFVVPHEELADAVSQAIDSPNLRRKIAKAGTKAVQKFAWDVVGGQWAEYLAETYIADNPSGKWADEWRAILKAENSAG